MNLDYRYKAHLLLANLLLEQLRVPAWVRKKKSRCTLTLLPTPQFLPSQKKFSL